MELWKSSICKITRGNDLDTEIYIDFELSGPFGTTIRKGGYERISGNEHLMKKPWSYKWGAGETWTVD